MNKYLRITEYLWLGLTIVALLTTAWMFINGAQQNGIFCLMITLFCGVMWNMRRMFNRRVEREAKKRAEEAASGKR